MSLVEYTDTIVSLYLRKTRSYVDEYRHLDDQEWVGDCKVLSSERLETEDDESDRWFSILKVIVAAPTVETIQAIKDTFTQAGCACEHDCCGCESIRVTDVVETGPWEYAVKRTHTLNY